MSINKFIEDRKTPYSEITNIVENEDGTIFYSEKYYLNHPMCPITRINNESTLTLNQNKPNYHFEILYGSIDIIEDSSSQKTKAFLKETTE